MSDAVSGMRWNSGQRLAVLIAVDNDYKTIDLNGRDDMKCPVCSNATLMYRRKSIFAMTAWCTTCKTGIKQGNGA